MVSVVIPILIKKGEHFGMTHKCIDLARKHTNVDFELIIVETQTDYFREYADIHIYEKHKTTATKSINNAFRLVRSPFTVLLTNDVFVSEGWLEALLEPFNKYTDCGLSTLATTQLGHTREDCIKEGIWFSVACMKSEDAVFDENFVNSWDDTDLITRVYLSGRKMYRNYKCVVEHEPGQTHYGEEHNKNFEANEAYYRKKYQDYSDSQIYRIFTQGIVV